MKVKLNWDEIEVYKYLKDKNSVFIRNIDKMIIYAEETLPSINKIFSNYTGHGIDHSKMTIKYMSNLIDDFNDMSDLELTILIYCGLLHDIGMVITDYEIELFKSNKFLLTEFKYECVNDKYNDEHISLQEIIRPIHGRHSKDHILNFMLDEKNGLKSLFCIPERTNTYFAEEVANICMAHNEEFDWLKCNLIDDDVKGIYHLNPQFIAVILRLADLLDIDENRTPVYLYNLLNPQGNSSLEWKQHFIIENSEKVVFDEKTGFKTFIFYGESKEPDVHRKILKYIDYINSEIRNATSLSENMRELKYLLKIKSNVNNRIRTKTFNFSDFKLSLNYAAVTNLLMGENIYGDKKYGLRELIQNSIDACKLMREESKHIQQFQREQYKPYIRIELDRDRNKVTIADNGIGMSLQILKKYFFNVGVSYYSSDEYKFKGYKYEPIGKYGIGFLSCFMLSEKVAIITKRFNENSVNQVDMEKQSEYICLTQLEKARTQGTDIVLDYTQFCKVFENSDKMKSFIDSNFIDSNIPIIISEFKGSELTENQCQLVSIETQTQNTIRLDKYLNGVSGFMEIKYKNIRFVKKLNEITSEDTYLYNESEIGDGSINDEEDLVNLNISKYINDNIITYITLPIIDYNIYDDFQKAYDVLEDYDDALNKLDNYNNLNIFFNPSVVDCDGSEILEGEDYIIGNFSIDDFCSQFGHVKNVSVSVELKQQLIVDIDENEFLCYKSFENIRYHYASNWPNNRGRLGDIFIRDVLLPECTLKIPFIVEGLGIQKFVFNITNHNVVPNVSRTDIRADILEDMSYAVGKAIHLWIYDNANLSFIQKELIKKFININYKENNSFIRA